jgi:hypothetical protein
MYELYVYPIRLCMHEEMFMLQVSTAGQTCYPIGFQLKGKSWVFMIMIRYLYEWFMLSRQDMDMKSLVHMWQE